MFLKSRNLSTNNFLYDLHNCKNASEVYCVVFSYFYRLQEEKYILKDILSNFLKHTKIVIDDQDIQIISEYFPSISSSNIVGQKYMVLTETQYRICETDSNIFISFENEDENVKVEAIPIVGAYEFLKKGSYEYDATQEYFSSYVETQSDYLQNVRDELIIFKNPQSNFINVSIRKSFLAMCVFINITPSKGDVISIYATALMFYEYIKNAKRFLRLQ